MIPQVKSSGALGVIGILSEREQTHGDYARSAELAQALKVRFRATKGAERLLPHQQEAVEMILFKLSRIASGNPGHADHWRDIAGYATLVLERLAKPIIQTSTGPKAQVFSICNCQGGKVSGHDFNCSIWRDKTPSLTSDDRYEG